MSVVSLRDNDNVDFGRRLTLRPRRRYTRRPDGE
jgi:hypothetical protein